MENSTQETVKPSAQPSYSSRFLIAEDDVPLSQFLRRGLQSEKSGVDVVNDGETALQALSQTRYSLLILDLNLPKRDGMSILQEIRPKSPMLPIMVLTARSRLEDRIMALDAGADDCMVKPFSFQELLARTRALMRRNVGSGSSRTTLQVGDLSLNRSELRAERAGKRLDLTAKEFVLLEYLMLNAPQPVTREMIMENVWKEPYDGSTNLIDVYVKYVRDKVDKDFPSKLLRTIRGVGYVLSDK
ncbi:MAG: response regulator transcription factor [Terriglobales bacterium]|jgi:two-component system copper resistance phosphate regulon response regulator CusR